MSKTSKSEREEALVRLREIVKPGDTVHCILRHVSRSGMSRSISLIVGGDKDPFDFSYLLPCLDLGSIDQKNGGVKIGGCGMDMGFALVNALSYTLYGEYDCTGEKCPSAAHANRDNPPAGTCRDHVERTVGVCHDKNCKPWHHKDGYALRHRWL